MIYTILTLLISNALPHNIEVKNKLNLTSIFITCAEDEYKDLTCYLDGIHYVIAGEYCEREMIKDRRDFINLSPRKWIQTYPDAYNKECKVVREETLELTNKGWEFKVEDRLVGTNPNSCYRFTKVVVYSETDNFTNVLCE